MQVCERLIGPPEVLGPAIGYGMKAGYHWRRERDGRRPGDLPSVEVLRRLLAHSAAHNLGLRAEHLIWGASEAEVEDILALRKLSEGARAIAADAAMTAPLTSIRHPAPDQTGVSA
jgi:hypothetical protein